MSAPKNKGGRPKVKIDYESLDKYCAIHCTGNECAALLDVSYEHLNNQLKKDGNGGFLDYFALKSANGKASLRRRQFQAAQEGNPTMLIWLGKQWLEQADNKATLPTFDFDFDTNSSPMEQAIQITKAASTGKIPPDIAAIFVQCIKNTIDIEEYTELKSRIEGLEKALSGES